PAQPDELPTTPDTETTPDVPPASAPAMSLQDAMRILEQEADRRATAEAELARAQAEEDARRQQAAQALAKARMVEDARQALTDLLTAVTTTYAALLADDEAAFATGLESIYGGTADVRKAARVSQPKATSTTAAWGSNRNAPRPLRPHVLEHLIKHPDLAFTANEIAKVLNRSSGAVANALDTLARNGEAELVSERPSRFRAAKPQDA
ncbi:helix-turn-helix domain-containing protein, partial [Spongiactinospora gelatinilytica]